MLGFIVLVACLGTSVSQNTGNFATISKDLRDLFQNSYSTVAWTSDTTFTTQGYPHYQVECHGTPNTATAQTSTLTIQSKQTVSTDSWCLPMGAIGYALNGVAIFNAASAEDEDAFTAEGQTFDGCGAHSEMRGNYHYHIMPGSTCPKTAGPLECFPQEKVPHYQTTNGVTIVVGVALDGFPIFATLNNGQVQEEPGVDECGGKNYHADHYAYFVSPKFPYFFGCFKGTNIQSSNRNANNLGRCTGITKGGLCYCKQGSTARTYNCLPAKGESSCIAGQDVNCNLNGRCLSWKPNGASTSTNTNTGTGTNTNTNTGTNYYPPNNSGSNQGQRPWPPSNNNQHPRPPFKRPKRPRPRNLQLREILKELLELDE